MPDAKGNPQALDWFRRICCCFCFGCSELPCCCFYCCKAPCGWKQDDVESGECPYNGMCYKCTCMKCVCFPYKMGVMSPGPTEDCVATCGFLTMFHLWCACLWRPHSYHPCASMRFGWRMGACLSGGCLDPDLDCNCSLNPMVCCNPCSAKGSFLCTGCNLSHASKLCRKMKKHKVMEEHIEEDELEDAKDAKKIADKIRKSIAKSKHAGLGPLEFLKNQKVVFNNHPDASLNGTGGVIVDYQIDRYLVKKDADGETIQSIPGALAAVQAFRTPGEDGEDGEEVKFTNLEDANANGARATIAGFSASTNSYMCKLEDGSIIPFRPMNIASPSTAGALLGGALGSIMQDTKSE